MTAQILDAPATVPPSEGEYVPFPNMEARNGMHARVEVPLMLRALRVPRGGRVLEIGCGRGGRTLVWRGVPALVRDRAALPWAAPRKTIDPRASNA